MSIVTTGLEVSLPSAPRKTYVDTIARHVFPQSPATSITPAKFLLAAAAVVAGTLVGLSRTLGPGAFNTIWAEDGNHFLSDALNQSTIDSLTRPQNGYFLLIPRVVGEFAALFPIDWAPAIMSTCAAVITAVSAVLVYVASAGHFPSVLPRLAVSVPVVATHVSILVVPNNVATLQFGALYLMFWMLLWTPSSRAGRVVAVSTVVLIGFNTILTAALLPLALLRLIARRDRYSWTMLAATALPLACQVLALATGYASRGNLSTPRWNPIWALAEYLLWALPYSILGERWLMPPGIGMNVPPGMDPPNFDVAGHKALLVLAWSIAVGAVVLAARGITRPAWGLAAVSIICSASVFSLQMMANGFPGPVFFLPELSLLGVERYLLGPGLMVVTTMVALLRPHPRDAAVAGSAGSTLQPWPIVVYATLLAVVCASGLRTESSRSMTRPWDEVLQQARQECLATGEDRVNAHYGGEVWWPPVVIPCRKLLR